MDLTIGGVPIHPLLVHAAVVFIPALAVLLIIAAFRPSFRARLGIWLPIATTVVLFTSFFTAQSGEALDHTTEHTALLETHTELGDLMTPVMFVLTVLVWGYWFLAKRAGGTESTLGRLMFWGAALVSVAALVLVVLIGDSGAKAVWLG